MNAKEFLKDVGFDKDETINIDDVEMLLNQFGKVKWIEAQKDANGFRMDKFKDGKYPAATMTPYKK